MLEQTGRHPDSACSKPNAAAPPGPALLDDLARRHAERVSLDLLRAAIKEDFAGRIAVVSSFGAESAVILDMVARIDSSVPVLFLDTGKHFPETLAYRDELAERLGLTDLRGIAPDRNALTAQDAGGTLWRSDPERCCALRKVAALAKALEGFDAWITGRKRFQGGLRGDLAAFEFDDGRIKINPFAHWTAEQIAAAFKARDLPPHPLVARGFPSIGCQPCTAPADTHDPRAGRWAGQAKTECGIHKAAWAAASAPGHDPEQRFVQRPR